MIVSLLLPNTTELLSLRFVLWIACQVPISFLMNRNWRSLEVAKVAAEEQIVVAGVWPHNACDQSTDEEVWLEPLLFCDDRSQELPPSLHSHRVSAHSSRYISALSRVYLWCLHKGECLWLGLWSPQWSLTYQTWMFIFERHRSKIKWTLLPRMAKKQRKKKEQRKQTRVCGRNGKFCFKGERKKLQPSCIPFWEGEE